MNKLKRMIALFIIILLVPFCLSFYNSFPKEFEEPLFCYSYECGEFSERLETKRFDGVFYVLEKPVIKKWENGTIEIDSLYYDGYSLNIEGYVTSENDSFENDLKDINSSAYFKISGLKFRKLKLSSWAYDLVEENDNAKKYKFFMGCFTKVSKCDNLKIEFENVKLDIKMKKVLGLPIENNTNDNEY